MTITQMHELCDLLIDKANAPWFNPTEKDLFINLAQVEYLDKKYKLFEINEEIREKLLPLVKTTTLTGSLTQFNLTSITDFRYILGVRGIFPDGCGGFQTASIKPVQLDDEVDTQKDPFNKANDFFPQYIQENDGINDLGVILSDNPATSITIKYLKTPIPVNINTSTDSELSPSSHEEIVYLAVQKMLGNVQDQFGYQVMGVETNK